MGGGEGGGVDVVMGDNHFFISLQLSHIYSVCVGGAGGGTVRFPLLLFESSAF